MLDYVESMNLWNLRVGLVKKDGRMSSLKVFVKCWLFPLKQVGIV